MHTTHLRKDHLHGLMVGVAIGDALGGVRAGLPRRVALKMSGRPPLHYSLLGGRGLYGDETQLMLLAAQALLRSRSDLRSYRRAFQKRLSWYPLGFPPGARRATRLAASRCWLMRLRIPSGIDSEDNAAATRAIFSALAMHGTGHRLSRWVEESTKFTHTHPMAIAGCQVLAQLAEYAALTSPAEFDAAQAVHQAIRNCNQPSLRQQLRELLPFLEQRRSPRAVARHFGWEREVEPLIVPTTLMASYCWLRYPTDFRRAVETAATLGGASDSLAAVTGGLVGAHVGFRNLPETLAQRLGGAPHGPDWIATLAERLASWPHGMDDLHRAPAQSSHVSKQLLRNILTLPRRLMRSLLRLPFRMVISAHKVRRSR